MHLDQRIAALEAQNAPNNEPVEFWFVSPTTEEDLERGWQRMIRNFYDPERNAWDSEEVRVDARIYSDTNEIERFVQG